MSNPLHTQLHFCVHGASYFHITNIEKSLNQALIDLNSSNILIVNPCVRQEKRESSPTSFTAILSYHINSIKVPVYQIHNYHKHGQTKKW